MKENRHKRTIYHPKILDNSEKWSVFAFITDCFFFALQRYKKILTICYFSQNIFNFFSKNIGQPPGFREVEAI